MLVDMGNHNAGAQNGCLPPFPYACTPLRVLGCSRSDDGSLSVGPSLRAVFSSR